VFEVAVEAGSAKRVGSPSFGSSGVDTDEARDGEIAEDRPLVVEVAASSCELHGVFDRLEAVMALPRLEGLLAGLCLDEQGLVELPASLDLGLVGLVARLVGGVSLLLDTQKGDDHGDSQTGERERSHDDDGSVSPDP
jgi:hypothetical protein